MLHIFQAFFDAKGDNTLHFVPSNKQTLEQMQTLGSRTPKDIVRFKDYPYEATKNAEFFQYRRLDEGPDPFSGFRVTVHMYSMMSVLDLKQKVLPMLRNLGLWMTSDSIWKSQTTPVAYLFLTHVKFTHWGYRTKQITDELESMAADPARLPNNAQDPKDDKTGDVEFADVDATPNPTASSSKVRLNAEDRKSLRDILADKDFSLKVIPSTTKSRHDDKVVQSEVLAVHVPNPMATVLRKVLAELPSDCLGGSCTIVPSDYHRDVSDDQYCSMLLQHNSFHYNTSPIMLHNVHRDIFSQKFTDPDRPNFDGTVIEYLYKIGIQLVEPTNSTAEKGKYICIVNDDNKDDIGNELARIFETRLNYIGDGTFRTKCLTQFSWYPSVGRKRSRPRLCPAKRNAVLARFADHQPLLRREMKRTKIHEKLIVTCVPDNFPGTPKPSTTVSPAVTFAAAARYAPSVHEADSDVTDNNSSGSNDKTTKTEVSALTTAVSTIQTVLTSLKSQQEEMQKRQDHMEQQMRDDRDAFRNEMHQGFQQGFAQLLAQLSSQVTMMMNNMAVSQQTPPTQQITPFITPQRSD